MDGAVLTPNICRRSGSRNRKGMLETCNLLGCCLSVLSEECSCWLSVCAASSVCWGRQHCHQPLTVPAPCPQWECAPAQCLALSAPRDTLDPVVPRFWAVPHGWPSVLVSQGDAGGAMGMLGVGVETLHSGPYGRTGKCRAQHLPGAAFQWRNCHGLVEQSQASG